ncbi:hypothetical protein GCM10008995_28760 [Halobellus salinus]|uniref:Uncharacterized protein n=2 Tax=Halobellus salinus TaxID=931585 RepID=A0A830EEA2_9EURY|nr:hypothetical protein GCM10008995_28760 [Halobellus salinus]
MTASTAATLSGLAGCGGATEGLRPQEEDGVWDDDASAETQVEEPITPELVVKDVSVDSIHFTLHWPTSPTDDSVQADGALRVYFTALHGGKEALVAETEATVTNRTQEHELSLEVSEEIFNVPQEIEVRFKHPDGDAEAPLATDDPAYLPFDNESRGAREIRTLGPKFASEEKWEDDTDPKQKVEIWYNEPEESPFNVPNLDKSEYNQTNVDGDDWFDLYNIELTALVRTPLITTEFHRDNDDEVQGPYYDWTVFTLRLSEIEYLEAVYCNSPSTLMLRASEQDWSIGDGGARQKEVSDKTNYGSNVTVDDIEDPVAQESDDAIDKIFDAVFDENISPNELNGANPIRFAAGRSVSRRWARKIEEAFENKPYVSFLETPEYHKLTVLKAFIGGALPYKWTVGDYHNSPEESIVELFKNGTQGIENTEGADCVTASVLFAGIGYWLVDAEPVLPFVYVSGSVKHLFTGWGGLNMPDLSDIRTANALGYHEPDSTHSSDRIPYDYWNVECTEGFPTIGFTRTSIADTQYLTAWSNGEPLQLTTNIRLNENDEPDIDGEVKSERTEISGLGIVDAFDTPLLYKYE